MGKHVEKLNQGIQEVISKQEADAQNVALTKARALDAAARVLVDLSDDPKFIKKAVGIIRKDLDIYKEHGDKNADKIFSEAIKSFSKNEKKAIEEARLSAVASVADSKQLTEQVAEKFKSKPIPVMQH